MTTVLQYLADHHILFTFLLIGVGMWFGNLKIKGVGLGAAAVLFLAIFIAALATHYGITASSGTGGIAIASEVGVLGLALFAFAIGNSQAKSFFQSLKHATKPIVATIVVLAVGALVALLVGRYIFGMDIALIAGTFSGGITNTPALAAAGEASGNEALATVGYAVAYLFGVMGMIIAAGVALRNSSKDKDAPAAVTHLNVRVDRDDKPTIHSVERDHGGRVEISRLSHGEKTGIHIPEDTEVLSQGDLVTIVGTLEDVTRVCEYLGHESTVSLRSDRRMLDFRRIILSNHELAGRTVAELDKTLEERWGAKISRVRRGDVDMLAIPELMLEMGDRIRVVGPTYKLKTISKWLGDSSRGLSDINPVSLGLGLALGYFIGEIEIPIPGGGHFALGYAAGVLIVGLVMGKVGRIGKFVTALPNTANAVLAELGLLMFLARAGTNAGTQILNAFQGGDWWRILILGACVTVTVGVGLHVVMRGVFKMGGTQLSGLLGGAQTQPAVLAFANGRTGSDPRVALGYALVYPVSMITKILLAHLLGSL